jgi:sarcosine oxidase subunit delta
MFLIACPWCGPRDQSEFRCGGEAHIARPMDGAGMTDAAWGDYVFMRRNPKGPHRERWVHIHGCRRWFNVARDTATDTILAVYRPGDVPPDLPGSTRSTVTDPA